MSYKKLDEREARCQDCLYMFKKFVRAEDSYHKKYKWYCRYLDLEIHAIEDDKCWVMSKNYPYIELEDD